MNEVVYEAVSLGDSCETKFQIARRLNAQGHPGRSPMAFRLELVPPGRGERLFGWDLLDWLGAPIEAVCAYLEADFRGVFEREDLVVVDGAVMHRRLGINHVHDFEGEGQDVEARIDQLYPAERMRFEARAEAFRRRLTGPGPCLYIHHAVAFPTAAQAARLIAALSARSPDHRFHLLFIGFPEYDQDLSALADKVSKAWRGPEEGKPAGRGWEGNDAAWDIALAPFRIAPPAEQAAGAHGPGLQGRWVPFEVSWHRLAGETAEDAGRLPLQVDIPAGAWAYGLVSGLIAAGPSRMLRLRVTVHTGGVGVAMMAPSGDQLLSAETAVFPEDGLADVLLPLDPQFGPAQLLLRNLAAEGQAGRVTLHGADIAPRD